MTEGISSAEDAAAARAAEQVRLRKLRREAKIKAGGASRLDKITGLYGNVKETPSQPAPSDDSTPSTPRPILTPPTASSNSDADPEEVDISRHYPSQPTSRPSQNNDISNRAEALHQMMRFDGSDASTPSTPFNGNLPPMPGMEGFEQDPMMQMFQKMMAGGMPGAAPGGMPGMPGMPAMPGTPGAGGPAGANPFSGLEGLFGGAGAANPLQQQQQAEANKTANLWRILHAIFALGLGLYVALATTFTGSKTEREANDLQSTGVLGAQNLEQTRAWFFYVFTSVEAVLLTSRYMVERGPGFTSSGWAWTVTGFLPDPFKSYTRSVLRYGQIFATVRNDALFCVFVMGVCCLLRS